MLQQRGGRSRGFPWCWRTTSCGHGLASNVSSLPVVSPHSAEERFEMYSSEEDEDEDSFVPVSRIWQLRNPECVASRITWRDLRVLESAWYCWLNRYRDSKERRFTGNVIEETSDSDGDLPRTPIQEFRATQDRKALEHAWAHWI